MCVSVRDGTCGVLAPHNACVSVNSEGGSCAGAVPPAGLHAEVAQMGLQDREQVLRDAELARRLQEEEEEEERLLRKGQRPGNDISPPVGLITPCPSPYRHTCLLIATV